MDHHKRVETYNPYCYTGRELDSQDLYYYRARYYDPSVGRFISKDPIEFLAGDTNFYRYVGGDPVNFVDPSGLARGQKNDPCAHTLKHKKYKPKIKVKAKDLLKRPNIVSLGAEALKLYVEEKIESWVLGEIEKAGAHVEVPEYIGPGSAYYECQQKQKKEKAASANKGFQATKIARMCKKFHLLQKKFDRLSRIGKQANGQKYPNLNSIVSSLSRGTDSILKSSQFQTPSIY